MAMIQPPETARAFVVALSDANASIRIVASAGWIRAEPIPAEAVARLESIPPRRSPLLIECTADTDDGHWMNTAMVLRRAPPVRSPTSCGT